ncbi:MAG: copper oxidase [Firmicutes bacterium HGW-Firmicutes-8]|nr:MAG: copper oxidase [Firmicutes bacterium HGW-Firmicutes-8]
MAIRHYVLLATDGFVDLPTTPDVCPNPSTRQRTYIFGFVGGLFKVDDKVINSTLDWTDSANLPALLAMKGTATLPAPIIWAEIGDHLYITLINLGMAELPDLLDFHTVHLHGAHVATQVDGFPETSFGVPMWMDTTSTPPNATYFFQPEHPGTLMYHCHVEASEHVQMGMYGALVIYPSIESLAMAGITKNEITKQWFLDGKWQSQIPGTATNRNFAYNDIQTFFDKEYVMLLSDIDSTWHEAVRTQDPTFNAVNYRPNFWLVNGRAFPDTLLPHPQTPSPGSDPDLTQINYESYVHIKTGNKFLLRMINLAYQVAPWHIHGWHFMVIGKDSNPSPFLAIAPKLGLMPHEAQEHGFTATIGSGETYDLLLTADDKRSLYKNYIINGQDGLPSLCAQLKALQSVDPGAIFDIPTEPVSCPGPNTVNYINICDGTQGVDQFFPQFYPMHNHDDYKVTNDGTYPGGQLTYIQTDAPEGKDDCMEGYECEDVDDDLNGD